MHARALRLGDTLRTVWPGNAPLAGDAPVRAQTAMTRLAAATQLMETISWLLIRHAGDARPSRWHAGRCTVPRCVTGERATVAAAIDRLYAEIIAIDESPAA